MWWCYFMCACHYVDADDDDDVVEGRKNTCSRSRLSTFHENCHFSRSTRAQKLVATTFHFANFISNDYSLSVFLRPRPPPVLHISLAHFHNSIWGGRKSKKTWTRYATLTIARPLMTNRQFPARYATRIRLCTFTAYSFDFVDDFVWLYLVLSMPNIGIDLVNLMKNEIEQCERYLLIFSIPT